MRASTFFQKCRDQQWYINQLLRQQAQNLSQIRELKDRVEREQIKNLQYSGVDGGKVTKYKMKDSHVDDLMLIQQHQQAIFNDAASFSITDDLKKLSSDASRNRNRVGHHEVSNKESLKTDSPSSSSHQKAEKAGKSLNGKQSNVSKVLKFKLCN